MLRNTDYSSIVVANKFSAQKRSNGFTVLELLISLGLVVVAFVVFIRFFNPDQFLKESRDRKRIQDLDALVDALNRYIDLGTGTTSLGTVGVVYGSTEGVIRTADGQEVPIRYETKNPTFTNSLGWLPANFDLVQTKQFSDLPRDPRNLDQFIYTFSVDGKGGYKLTTAFESLNYRDKMSHDCGSNAERYEVGTDCLLQP